MTKVIDVVSAVSSEAVACVDVLTGRFSRHEKPECQGPGGLGVDVVMIHGFMSSARDMRHWEEHLSDVSNTRSVAYESLGRGFFATAELLLAEVEDVRAGAVLVGHSLGGIFCRYIAESSLGKYSAVVTVCSPNTARDAGLGTKITSRIAGSMQTAVDGAAEYLSSRETWDSTETACYTFGAECDMIVSERSSRLAGAEHSVIQRAGHMSVLRRSEVTDKVSTLVLSYENARTRQ